MSSVFPLRGITSGVVIPEGAGSISAMEKFILVKRWCRKGA
jgi:hypothetical protein